MNGFCQHKLIMEAMNEAAFSKWPFLLSPMILGLGAYFLSWLLSQKSLARFPLVGIQFGNEKFRERAFIKNAGSLYSEGYRKVNFSDSISFS
jgi:hypothetical protein